uniref:Uncharacterized protein n=1 Tax=Lepeophtheirus salmonis TaxID=72036 RepID=A0A0K2V274_LEPSM
MPRDKTNGAGDGGGSIVRVDFWWTTGMTFGGGGLQHFQGPLLGEGGRAARSAFLIVFGICTPNRRPPAMILGHSSMWSVMCVGASFMSGRHFCAHCLAQTGFEGAR